MKEKDLNHEKFMKIALALAKKGAKKVHPNPMVGCVIVRDNKIIGKGNHEYFGGPHAEVNALRQAGAKAKGATLYTTLEPCNHWGKTPPCSEAIVRAGIDRVVSAMRDPNPSTRGKGFKTLKKAGIEVVNDVLNEQAVSLNKDFLDSLKRGERKVILKAAMTLDGKIAAYTGDSKWITGKTARRYVHILRSRVDAVLVGINTVIKDNPALTSHGAGKNPLRVIIDPALRIPLRSSVLDDKAVTIVIHSSSLKDKLELLKQKSIIPIFIATKNGKIKFKEIINYLSKMSIKSILIEGGGETAYHALSAKVVDEVNFFIAPKLIGGRDAKTPVEGTGIARINDCIVIKEMNVKKIGRDFLLTGRL
jgi:diaminohydroxyphosphoribosylaminopyrimidine deaminase / 5-amino-6-(5-phosphoribosylamino)uracil reductase